MKTLTEKIKSIGKKAFIIGGLGGCAIGIGGNTSCQTLTPQGEAFIQGLGQSAIYTMVNESIKAEVNPNQINVYNQGGGQGAYVQQPQQVIQEVPRQKGLKEILEEKYNNPTETFAFACNYWRDFNNNGSADFDEFSNIKYNFRKDEKITIIGIIRSNLDGKILDKEILDNNGRTIKLEREPICKEQKDYVCPFEINPQELERGIYTAVFSSDRNYFTRTEFEVGE